MSPELMLEERNVMTLLQFMNDNPALTFLLACVAGATIVGSLEAIAAIARIFRRRNP